MSENESRVIRGRELGVHFKNPDLIFDVLDDMVKQAPEIEATMIEKLLNQGIDIVKDEEEVLNSSNLSVLDRDDSEGVSLSIEINKPLSTTPLDGICGRGFLSHESTSLIMNTDPEDKTYYIGSKIFPVARLYTDIEDKIFDESWQYVIPYDTTKRSAIDSSLDIDWHQYYATHGITELLEILEACELKPIRSVENGLVILGDKFRFEVTFGTPNETDTSTLFPDTINYPYNQDRKPTIQIKLKDKYGECLNLEDRETFKDATRFYGEAYCAFIYAIYAQQGFEPYKASIIMSSNKEKKLTTQNIKRLKGVQKEKES